MKQNLSWNEAKCVVEEIGGGGGCCSDVVALLVVALVVEVEVVVDYGFVGVQFEVVVELKNVY